MRLQIKKEKRREYYRGMEIPKQLLKKSRRRKIEWYRRAVCRRRSPEEWSAIIETIKDRIVRGYVARIVWWDYFGQPGYAQKYEDNIKILDEYVNEVGAPLVHPKKIIIGLIRCGWPKNSARTRLRSYIKIWGEGVGDGQMYRMWKTDQPRNRY